MSTNEVTTDSVKLVGFSIYSQDHEKNILTVCNLRPFKSALESLFKRGSEGMESAYYMRKSISNDMLSSNERSLYNYLYNTFNLRPINEEEKFVYKISIILWLRKGMKITYPYEFISFYSNEYVGTPRTLLRKYGNLLVESMKTYNYYLN